VDYSKFEFVFTPLCLRVLSVPNDGVSVLKPCIIGAVLLRSKVKNLASTSNCLVAQIGHEVVSLLNLKSWSY
jgi:hypothetical protein